jgi:hypothetical protein
MQNQRYGKKVNFSRKEEPESLEEIKGSIEKKKEI